MSVRQARACMAHVLILIQDQDTCLGKIFAANSFLTWDKPNQSGPNRAALNSAHHNTDQKFASFNIYNDC